MRKEGPVMVMDLDRFAALAGAYGGDVSRWPPAEREAAARLMAQDAQATASLLSAENDLDGVLDAWRAPNPSLALRDTILASAPAYRAPAGWRTWIWRTGLGAGLVAAGAAGLMVGVVASGAVGAPVESDVIAAAVAGYDGLDLDTVSLEGV